MAGYDYKFVKPPPNAFQTECPVCLHVLREPYQAKCCGKCFCSACYKRLQDDKKACPHCNDADFPAYEDKRQQQTLIQLEVYCAHKDRGCKWTGELGNLDRHLNENPKEGAEKDGCDFAQIQCPHCQVVLERRFHKINRAHFDDCPKRHIHCINCGKGCNWQGEQANLENHLKTTCVANLRNCPKNCGQRVHHLHLNNHIKRDCTMTIIECDFKSMGCKEQLPRKDMPNHLNEGLHSHMLLLMERNHKLEEENAALMKQAAAETIEVERIKANVDRVQRDNVSKTEVRKIQQEMRSKVSMKWLVLVSAITVVGLAFLLKIQLKASKADLQKELHEQITNITQNVTSFQKEHTVAYREFRTQLSTSINKTLNESQKELHTHITELQHKLQQVAILNNLSFVQLADVNRIYIQQGFTLHKFTLTEFTKYQAKGGWGDWNSEPFYSHPGGYKFKLNVETNGYYTSGIRGVYVSVIFLLLQGDHDDKLDWPVTATAHVQLLNQLRDHDHHEKTSTGGTWKKTQRGDYDGRIEKFIKITDLGVNAHKNIQYLKDDHLYFRVYIKCNKY